MMHANISKSREQEIYILLVELNALFGNEFKGDTPQISMYGTFEGTNNVLFPVSNVFNCYPESFIF